MSVKVKEQRDLSLPKNTIAVTVGGPVTVTYRQHQKQWVCTALQFDLVGIGDTRLSSLDALQEMFNTYLEAVFQQAGPVRFYNPSEPEEWDVADQEQYQVKVLFTLDRRKRSPIPKSRIRKFASVRNYRDRVRSVSLERIPQQAVV